MRDIIEAVTVNGVTKKYIRVSVENERLMANVSDCNLCDYDGRLFGDGYESVLCEDCDQGEVLKEVKDDHMSEFATPSGPTYTEKQIKDAYEDLFGTGHGEQFVNHLKRFADPEYQEFLRLKEKFQ